MEKWLEIYKGCIPPDNYVTKIEAGEEKGLLVVLEDAKNLAKIDFGAISAFRMIDEGMILNNLFKAPEVPKYKAGNFKNTIYQIEKGEFGEMIKNIYGEIYDLLKYTHYVIVTLNFVIEVVSQCAPKIEIITIDTTYTN